MEPLTDLYRHEVTLLDGSALDLQAWRGHPTLIVNTASKCGLTPQFAGLQELHETYGGRGLKLLGTPSGDFAGQELDTAEEIGGFCTRNYGVSFPLTEKLSVLERPAPLWADLARQPGSAPPDWNFAKYLVGGDGRLIAHFGARTEPTSGAVRSAIEAALG